MPHRNAANRRTQGGGLPRQQERLPGEYRAAAAAPWLRRCRARAAARRSVHCYHNHRVSERYVQLRADAPAVLWSLLRAAESVLCLNAAPAQAIDPKTLEIKGRWETPGNASTFGYDFW
jgi:hypothetical protein